MNDLDLALGSGRVLGRGRYADDLEFGPMTLADDSHPRVSEGTPDIVVSPLPRRHLAMTPL